MTRSTLSAIRLKEEANPSQSSVVLCASTLPPRCLGTDIVPMYTEPAGPRFRLGPQVAFDQRAFPGGSPPPAHTRRGIVGRALVLNATEQPFAVVAARRAVGLVLQEEASVVHAN